MPTLDPTTVAAVGLLAVTAILAAISYNLGRRSTDRKTASLRRRVFDADARYLHLAGELGKLSARVDCYAQDCDADSDDLADIARRVRRLEDGSRPKTRQTMADRMPAPVLALPAAPSVRDAIDPAWNGGTAVFDQLAAKFTTITDVPPLWEPPTERAVLTFPLASNDDTATIPRIEVTGELVEVTP